MKFNKFTILKLFIIHIIVYYVFFTVISGFIWAIAKEASFFDKEEITKIIISPILGITGMYDGYIFFIVPHILLVIIINRFFLKNNLLKSFFISSLFIYLFIYLNLKFDLFNISLFNASFFEKYSNSNILFIMIPSLIISFFFNWIFYRKT